jgi:hypothetical protein
VKILCFGADFCCYYNFMFGNMYFFFATFSEKVAQKGRTAQFAGSPRRRR